jgi:hypothetical protein
LEKYSKTIKSTFSEDDILFILNLSLENFVNEIEKLHTIYIEQTAKELKENSEFVLAVYQKIQDLNLIERYIFISRIKSLRKEKIKQTDIKTAIKHYLGVLEIPCQSDKIQILRVDNGTRDKL